MSEDVIAGDVTTVDSTTDDSNFDSFFDSRGEVETPVKEEAPAEPIEKEAEDKETDDGDKHVNNYKAAMHEEREKRKILQREFEETKAKTQRMEERFNELMYRQQQAAQPQEVIPNFETDPLGTLEYRNRKLSEQVYYQQQLEAQRQQDMAQSHQVSQFVNGYAETAREFSKNQPDFMEAYSHLVKTKLNELQIAGYSTAQAIEYAKQEEMGIVAKAYKDQNNPAEIMYKLAKERGYAQKSTQGADKIENIKKGIASSKTLTGKGGATGGKKISLEDVSNMSDAEFAKFDWKNMRHI